MERTLISLDICPVFWVTIDWSTLWCFQLHENGQVWRSITIRIIIYWARG